MARSVDVTLQALLLIVFTFLSFGVSKPQLVVIMLDGMRWDYLGLMPTSDLGGFQHFKRDGVRVEYVETVFPSLSLPAWTTLQTGLYPESHNVMGNRIYDRSTKLEYNGSTAKLPLWWQDAEPIWVTVTRQGLRAATIEWNHADVPFQGWLPEVAKGYSSSRQPFVDRIEEVVWYLKKGFDLVMMYYGNIDDLGHSFGPASIQVMEDMRRVGCGLERLFKHVESEGEGQGGSGVHVIMVSDHGMAPACEVPVVNLGQFIDIPSTTERVLCDMGNVAIFAKPGCTDDLLAKLQAVPGFVTRKRQDIPNEYHYKAGARAPDLLMFSAPPDAWLGLEPAGAYRRRVRGGGHGLDPLREPAMRAFFAAWGAAFAGDGLVHPPLRLVDVYQLYAYVLRVQPRPHNGSWDAVRNLLRCRPRCEMTSALVADSAEVPVELLENEEAIAHLRKDNDHDEEGSFEIRDHLQFPSSNLRSDAFEHDAHVLKSCDCSSHPANAMHNQQPGNDVSRGHSESSDTFRDENGIQNDFNREREPEMKNLHNTNKSEALRKHQIKELSEVLQNQEKVHSKLNDTETKYVQKYPNVPSPLNNCPTLKNSRIGHRILGVNIHNIKGNRISKDNLTSQNELETKTCDNLFIKNNQHPGEYSSIDKTQNVLHEVTQNKITPKNTVKENSESVNETALNLKIPPININIQISGKPSHGNKNTDKFDSVEFEQIKRSTKSATHDDHTYLLQDTTENVELIQTNGNIKSTYGNRDSNDINKYSDDILDEVTRSPCHYSCDSQNVNSEKKHNLHTNYFTKSIKSKAVVTNPSTSEDVTRFQGAVRNILQDSLQSDEAFETSPMSYTSLEMKGNVKKIRKEVNNDGNYHQGRKVNRGTMLRNPVLKVFRNAKEHEGNSSGLTVNNQATIAKPIISEPDMNSLEHKNLKYVKRVRRCVKDTAFNHLILTRELEGNTNIGELHTTIHVTADRNSKERNDNPNDVLKDRIKISMKRNIQRKLKANLPVTNTEEREISDNTHIGTSLERNSAFEESTNDRTNSAIIKHYDQSQNALQKLQTDIQTNEPTQAEPVKFSKLMQSTTIPQKSKIELSSNNNRKNDSIIKRFYGRFHTTNTGRKDKTSEFPLDEEFASSSGVEDDQAVETDSATETYLRARRAFTQVWEQQFAASRAQREKRFSSPGKSEQKRWIPDLSSSFIKKRFRNCFI